MRPPLATAALRCRSERSRGSRLSWKYPPPGDDATSFYLLRETRPDFVQSHLGASTPVDMPLLDLRCWTLLGGAVPQIDSPAVLTLEEAAAYLRLSGDALARQAAEGEIPGRQVAGEWRFLQSALDGWLGSGDRRRALLRHAGTFAADESLAAAPPTDSAAEQAVSAFAKAVQENDAVEAVYWRRDGDVFRVWSVLNEYEREVEDRVYQAEAETLDGYKNIPLAFRVLYRHGKDPAQVRPAQSQVSAS